jgi:hypothetical protein
MTDFVRSALEKSAEENNATWQDAKRTMSHAAAEVVRASCEAEFLATFSQEFSKSRSAFVETVAAELQRAGKLGFVTAQFKQR